LRGERGRSWKRKLKNEIRNSFPTHIAKQLCDAIDRKDNVDKFNRIMTEYDE